MGMELLYVTFIRGYGYAIRRYEDTAFPGKHRYGDTLGLTVGSPTKESLRPGGCGRRRSALWPGAEGDGGAAQRKGMAVRHGGGGRRCCAALRRRRAAVLHGVAALRYDARKRRAELGSGRWRCWWIH
uniref:Uncharacterized protein n=1 Tax=Oryza nivara TaxID=4536 RepID=A0A0E0FRL6_ORYNI